MTANSPMDLIKDDVAHDGHPDKGGEEAEDVEVTDDDTGECHLLLPLARRKIHRVFFWEIAVKIPSIKSNLEN